jgi:hypothetical protein
LDFLRLVESQRQLLTLQDQYYAAAAAYQERLADIDRTGGVRVRLNAQNATLELSPG